jgi:protein-ribulosamine 3-kinase
LPEYTGSGLLTRARKIVAELTDLPPESLIQYVDDNVAGELPPGTEIKGIFPHGSAYWTRTAAIQTIQADGTPLDFFLKICRTEVGRINLLGEYTTISAISQAVEGFTPKAIATGTYASDSDVHFYLASFVDMTDDVPEQESLPARVAEMHSKGISPNGKFGFSVSTCMGACQQQNEWFSSWEKSFSVIMSTMFEFEQEMHGEDKEMQRMHNIIMDKVIPRLLRPLETGGNEIKPRIVHGDMWDGNTSVIAENDKPVIFDASGMYAHNECESLQLAVW